MSRLIKLGEYEYVKREDISSIAVPYGLHRIEVRLSGGARHSVDADQGKTIHQTLKRLIDEVNEE